MWYMPTANAKSFRTWQTFFKQSNETPLKRSSFSNRRRQGTPGADTDSGYATPPTSSQDDQMGRIPPTLLDLHHSADNIEASPLDLTLTYPSGTKEHFAFGKRVQRRAHRYARMLSPIEDLIRTIEVLCIHYGSNTQAELQIMRRLLQIAYDHRTHLSAAGLPSLQDLINNIRYPTRHFHLPLTHVLVEHFFDQLHDRCIADIAHLLERPGTASRETTYGELTPSFISTLILQTSLDQESTFLDLGSGVGQIPMQCSLETGCTSFGVEREGRVHAVAITHLQQFQERAKLWGLEHGEVHLRKGDFLASGFVGELVGKSDVVLVNNLKLEPETDAKLQGMLAKGLKKGAKVVSTRPLVPIGRKRGRGGVEVGSKGEVKRNKKVGRPRKVVKLPLSMPTPPPSPEPEVVVEGDELLIERSGEDDVWTWNQYVYAAGSVSWSDKRGLYYVSVKK